MMNAQGSANPAAGNIRPYRESDWLDLCRIHDAARPFELSATVGMEAFLTLAETAEEEGLFEAAVDIVEKKGEVIGFVAYKPGELTWLYVHPDHFQRGYGRQLLRHALAAAGPVVMTEVLEGNAAATALYLSEGFSVKQRLAGKLVGNESFPAVGLVLEYAAFAAVEAA